MGFLYLPPSRFSCVLPCASVAGGVSRPRTGALVVSTVDYIDSNLPEVCTLALGCALVGCASGGGRRLRVLCAAPSCDSLLGAELLRGVRQRGGHDERGRHAHVLFPGKSRGRGGHAVARHGMASLLGVGCYGIVFGLAWLRVAWFSLAYVAEDGMVGYVWCGMVRYGVQLRV